MTPIAHFLATHCGGQGKTEEKEMANDFEQIKMRREACAMARRVVGFLPPQIAAMAIEAVDQAEKFTPAEDAYHRLTEPKIAESLSNWKALNAYNAVIYAADPAPCSADDLAAGTRVHFVQAYAKELL